MFVALMVALVAAIVGGIVGAYFTKWLTPNPMPEIVFIREELSKLKEHIGASEKDRLQQKQEDELWAAKFESAAAQVVRIGPSLMVRSPSGDSDMPLWGLVFPDVEMRGRILQFLVQQDSRYATFSMRMVSDEQLRRPVVRRVVDEALARIEDFKKQHPKYYEKYLKT